MKGKSSKRMHPRPSSRIRSTSAPSFSSARSCVDPMTDLQKWLLFLALTMAGVAASYLWLDRPIAFFVHEHVRQFSIFATMTQFPELIAPFAGAVLLVLGLLVLAGRPMAKPLTTVFLCGVSLIVAATIKTELKYVFGRTW